MNPEDLRTFGEVLAGQRIHDAALATLTRQEWTERWRSLGARRPQLSGFDGSRREIATWHRREAKRLEEMLQWDAAAWHLCSLRALGKPVDEERLRGLEAFVRSWRFARHSEPWIDRSSFVSMDDAKLRSIAASAAAQPLVRSGGPLVDFLFSFGGKNADVVGYAARTITSDRARSVRLLIGHDDALRVWLNGKVVIQRPGYHAPTPDAESVLVELDPGENTLVAEVSQAFGGWGLYLRLEDEDGRKLRLTDEGKLEPLDVPAAAGR
jgi:hypothetical protein